MAEQRDTFHLFVGEMNLVLVENESDGARGQSRLFKQLFGVEKQFRDELLSTGHGNTMYLKFMKFISEVKGNTLHAMPYFRERQNTFHAKVPAAFRNTNPAPLMRFRLNYVFAKWTIENWGDDGQAAASYRKQLANLEKLFEEIKETRRLLCENNLPLSINRAKMFWSRVPQSHLEYMDLIQNASEGLLTAIDKFTPPYKTVFRSTAIGRMTLNMSTDYNDTMVKLPPKDKRVLYRMKIAKSRENPKEKPKSEEDVLKFVQESFKDVTQADLAAVAAATTSVQSLEYENEAGVTLKDRMAGEGNPEQSLDNAQTQLNLLVGVEALEIIERKVVSLKTGY